MIPPQIALVLCAGLAQATAPRPWFLELRAGIGQSNEDDGHDKKLDSTVVSLGLDVLFQRPPPALMGAFFDGGGEVLGHTSSYLGIMGGVASAGIFRLHVYGELGMHSLAPSDFCLNLSGGGCRRHPPVTLPFAGIRAGAGMRFVFESLTFVWSLRAGARVDLMERRFPEFATTVGGLRLAAEMAFGLEFGGEQTADTKKGTP